jgi:hypothetical protein
MKTGVIIILGIVVVVGGVMLYFIDKGENK